MTMEGVKYRYVVQSDFFGFFNGKSGKKLMACLKVCVWGGRGQRQSSLI